MVSSKPSGPPNADFLANFTRAQRSLYAFLTTLIWRTADVEDVLQETNLVLWRKAAEFDPSRDFMPWAMRIAQLQAMSFLHRHKRQMVFDTELLDQLADEGIANRHEADDRREVLSECLQKLPDKHRLLIARRYEPGTSVNRLAEERGMQPKAVSESLRRIRRILLDCVERTLAGKVPS